MLGLAGSVTAQPTGPVVVELFTSQGCNSCPPADAFLGELAKRPDVIALGLHVDYWDYIGWRDPYAQRAHTERQRGYVRALNLRYAYTPQMVIDGVAQGVGSDRGAINRLIASAKKSKSAGPAVTLSGAGTQRTLAVSGVAGANPATVWLVAFDSAHRTAVDAGENKGERLANYNVVRAWQRLGEWTGVATEIPVDLNQIPTACDGAAILVQSDETGPIVAALRVELPKR